MNALLISVEKHFSTGVIKQSPLRLNASTNIPVRQVGELY